MKTILCFCLIFSVHFAVSLTAQESDAQIEKSNIRNRIIGENLRKNTPPHNLERERCRRGDWFSREKSPGRFCNDLSLWPFYPFPFCCLIESCRNSFQYRSIGAIDRHFALSGSDSVQVAWTAHYTSELAPGFDEALSMAVDDAGNVYVTGNSTNMPFGIDILTIKYNALGIQEWEVRYDGGADDMAAALALDLSGNIYVTGGSRGVESASDYVTIKYNSSGVEQWIASYNGLGNSYDFAQALTVDDSGNIYVTGGSGGDYATVKYNASGIEQWRARYNGPGNDRDYAIVIVVDSSGNVFITGTSVGMNAEDYATIKYSPSGEEQWVARYNGPGNYWDWAGDIAVDDSGNVFVTGGSFVSGTTMDYATIKYDSSGMEQWIARYNGGTNGFNIANAIAADAAGNVYITGRSDGEGTFGDYATLKYNPAGEQVWVDRYDGPISDYDEAYSIILDNSGNTYVTGWSRSLGSVSYAQSDYATIKYDSSGNRQWVTRYNGPVNGYDDAYGLAVDVSGNVYVTGRSEALSDYDFATIKYNSSGNEEWIARYDGPGLARDYLNDLTVDASGNIYVTGYSVGYGTAEDYATVKFNSNGVQEWDVRYDGPANFYDYPTAIAVDLAGNVYVTGESEGENNWRDFATIKYNSGGAEQWVVRYNAPGNLPARPVALALDRRGNVYVTGSAYYTPSGVDPDYTTIKYNSEGIQQWLARYNGPGNSVDEPAGMILDGWGNIYVTGTSVGDGSARDYATIKYNSGGEEQWIVRYSGLANDSDLPQAIGLDELGNVYVTGLSRNLSFSSDVVTIKYNTSGVQQWFRQFEGSVYDMAVDPSGDVYLSGNLRDNENNLGKIIIKYNGNGDEEWLRVIPSQYGWNPIYLRIDVAGSPYITSGMMGQKGSEDIVVIKYSADGEECWRMDFNSQGNADDIARAIAVDGMDNVFVGGSSTGYSWSRYTLLKLSQSVQDTTGPPIISEYELHQNVPNPFSSQTLIRYDLPKPGRVFISIFNILGEKVLEEDLGFQPEGQHTFHLKGDAFHRSGVYFYRIKTEGFVETKKMVLVW